MASRSPTNYLDVIIFLYQRGEDERMRREEDLKRKGGVKRESERGEGEYQTES